MTRVNAFIDVRKLTDEHLLAEHREIKRLPACLQVSIKSGSIDHLPDKFVLGKGHVLFFLNKMGYTLERYHRIYTELQSRGFNVTDFSDNWKGIPLKYGKGYVEDYEEVLRVRKLLFKRISQCIRESNKKVWHYCGQPISKKQAIELLKK